MGENPGAPNDLPSTFTKWSGVFTTVLAAATAVGGGAVTLSGGGDRMFREQPFFALVALLAGLSGFAFIALGLTIGRTKRVRSQMLAWSIVAFFAALGFGALAVLKTAGSVDQPGITGLITVTDGRPKLELTVTASGVRSDQRLNVLVSGVNAANETDPRALLVTVIGANREGVVSSTFSVDLAGEIYPKVIVAVWAVKPRPDFCDGLPKGDPRLDQGSECSVSRKPECDVLALGEGDRGACLVLTVPGSAQRPSLDLSLTRVDDGLKLTGSISALPERGHVVFVSIYPFGSAEALYSAKLVPGLDGSISSDLDVGLDPALAEVCIVAVEGTSSPLMTPACPVPAPSQPSEFAAYTTWLTLTAPPAPTASDGPSAEPDSTPMPD